MLPDFQIFWLRAQPRVIFLTNQEDEDEDDDDNPGDDDEDDDPDFKPSEVSVENLNI